MIFMVYFSLPHSDLLDSKLNWFHKIESVLPLIVTSE